jgi:hypothetical protein
VGISLRIVGTHEVEIRDLDGWRDHARPAGGDLHWVDDYSAKEQAKAWLRPGHPEVPQEILVAVTAAGFGGLEQWTAHPEHATTLDEYGRGGGGRRHHDMLILLGDPDAPVAVVGIEAKACETFGGLVSEQATAPPPSKLPARCNAMARALFGRPVVDEQRRELTDADLGAHGYQLWTGAVGTLREAQACQAPDALFLIHQFEPGAEPRASGDKRNWERQLAHNKTSIARFVDALGELPATSHETEFVEAGRGLHVLSVSSTIR